jgi:hypothetical protein
LDIGKQIVYINLTLPRFPEFNSAECFVSKYSSCLFIPAHFEENGSCEGAIQDWRVKRGFQDWMETLSLPMQPKQRPISNMLNCWVDMLFTLLLILPYCCSSSMISLIFYLDHKAWFITVWNRVVIVFWMEACMVITTTRVQIWDVHQNYWLLSHKARNRV